MIVLWFFMIMIFMIFLWFFYDCSKTLKNILKNIKKNIKYVCFFIFSVFYVFDII